MIPALPLFVLLVLAAAGWLVFAYVLMRWSEAKPATIAATGGVAFLVLALLLIPSIGA